MGEIIEPILVLLIFVIAVVSKNKKAKRAGAAAASKERMQRSNAASEKPAAPVKAAPPVKPQPVRHASKEEQPAKAKTDQRPSQGSIVIPPAEPHTHEGPDPSCPAEQYEVNRPAVRADRERRQTPAQVKVPGLSLSLDSHSLVQSVIMSEVLTRPAFRNGRRIIR